MTMIERNGLEFYANHEAFIRVDTFPYRAEYCSVARFSVYPSEGGAYTQVWMNDNGSVDYVVTKTKKEGKWIERRHTDPNEVDYLVGVDLPAIYRELRKEDMQARIEVQITHRRAEIAALEALKENTA